MAIDRLAGRVSRRTLMKGAAVGGAGLALGASVATQPVARAALLQDKQTVRFSGPTASPEEAELLQQVLGNFATKFPNVEVKYEPVPANYEIKLQTDLASGNAADVFYVKSEFAQDYMSRDVLLSLDDRMAKSGVKPADFYPGLIKAFQWQGKTYGLPKDYSPLAMVYDTEALTKAGVEKPPATWDELRAAGEKLKESTGQPSIVYPAAFDRFIPFMYQAGGNVTDEEATKITLDDPVVLQALDFYYGLYKDGLAATPPDVGAEWPGDAIAKGLAAIVFEGNWFFPFATTNAPDLKFAVAELPAGPKGKGSPGFTVSYAIGKASKAPDAAWELVNYLTGSEGMADWTSKGLAMPSRPALSAEWLKKFPEREAYVKAGEYAKGVQYGPGGQKFNDDANAVLQDLFAGGIDTKEAQSQLVEKAKADITLAQ